ncbi:MAG: hypothetical protein IT257_01655 [Chitinophagaceae bacterium]|nr:hypothetical protein [Chitinophagaceae bacterium]
MTVSIKFYYIFLVGSLIVFASCHEKDAASTPPVKAITVNMYKQDTTRLNALLRNMYAWYETKCTKGDFMPADPVANQDSFLGIDIDLHQKKLGQLKSSGFFSQGFVDNYNQIARMIDTSLQTGQTAWLVGDLSPFSTGADNWCDCQDNPDHYWETMSITITQSNDSSATLLWNWLGKDAYQVEAVKVEGAWKIAGMQGFRYANYAKMRTAQ